MCWTPPHANKQHKQDTIPHKTTGGNDTPRIYIVGLLYKSLDKPKRTELKVETYFVRIRNCC